MKGSAILASGTVVCPAFPSLGTASQPALELRLFESVEAHWRKYQTRLKRCQKTFSEMAVHDLRISLRQLIALLEAIQVMCPRATMGAARRRLKKQLNKFSPLRDFQVQLAWLDKQSATNPALQSFIRKLRKKEAKLIRHLASSIRSFKTSAIRNRIQKGLHRFVGELEDQPEKLIAQAREALATTYAEVRRRRTQLRVAAPTTIHRLRVAFKKYRYMAMALQPVLSVIPKPGFEQLKNTQLAMGNIQDQYVLGREFDAFLRPQPARKQRPLQPLRLQLERQLKRDVNQFLRRSEILDRYAPKHYFGPLES